MKILGPSFHHAVFIPLIIIAYVVAILIRSPAVFMYRFDSSLVDRYLCSQDIPIEPPCKRLFLSDEEIHSAAGYLYVKGEDPTKFNFQHPPLIKYLYGFSILLTRNPYWAQIALGVAFLVLTYLIGYRVFSYALTGFLACLLLVMDPLFIRLSGSTLLDLGQGTFLLLYFFLMIYFRKQYVVQGIALGCLLTSKFWGGSLFFILVIAVYAVLTKKVDLKSYFKHLVVALVVVCGIYTRSFLTRMGFFNIFFFELKVLKYWLQHSTSTSFGSASILFLTGFVKTWWGDKSWTRELVWSLMWPITFFVSSIRLLIVKKGRSITSKNLIAGIAFGYLAFLSIQAPFSRYFVLILPFLYLTLADTIALSILKLTKHRTSVTLTKGPNPS